MDFEILDNVIPSNDTDEIVKEFRNNRCLIINQDIDDRTIEQYSLQIIKWNKEDKDIPPEKRKPIKIFINSVGGDLFVAMHLVDVINSSNTKIIGIGTGLVASAAFHIYLSCHERYAFENSIFLMHDGSIDISSSSGKAKDTMKFFEKVEYRVKNHVINNTNMTEDFYDSHYESELYMYADEAKEFGVVDYIIDAEDNLNIDVIL